MTESEVENASHEDFAENWSMAEGADDLKLEGSFEVDKGDGE